MRSLPGPFKVKIPEIYQIEVSSVCDHNCIMCPRNYYHRANNTPFFDLDLLLLMIERRDFEGSYFVELQMSGEPLLYKNIQSVIDVIKSLGIKVGLSTHGDLFPKKLSLCEDLDYITISVDSITKRNEVRPGSKIWEYNSYVKNLIESILFFSERGIPVDLQIIEIGGWEEQRDILKEILSLYHIDEHFLRGKVTVRTIPDCCILHRDNEFLSPDEDKGVCLNPWLSVSVQSNGNVVPCCFAWGDEIVYGNLNNNSLEEIWNGLGPNDLRHRHEAGYNHLPDLCRKCYQRSPALLHWQIYLDSIKKGGK